MTPTHLIAGMPNSGKSTFIAALRHLLVSGGADTALEFVRFADDEKHLDFLEEQWVKCEEIPRTRGQTDTWVRFHLRDKVSGAEVEITLPDLSGEAFRQPASTGICRKTLFDAIVASDAVMLFTNSNRAIDDLMIHELNELYGEEDEPHSMPDEPFNPDKMPEEALLVELLQVFNRKPLTPKRRRMAVIVSAWDVGEREGMTPAEWFNEKRPMLADYLSFSGHLWDFRIYGVSALGGALPKDRETLQKAVPATRIKVVGPEVSENDITIPMKWLMQVAA